MMGPMLGANPMAMPAMPMVVPVRSLGKRVMASDCTSGSVMPVATACSTRPSTSVKNVRAIRSTAEPARKSPRARHTRRLTDIRRARNVTTGTVMPITSM